MNVQYYIAVNINREIKRERAREREIETVYNQTMVHFLEQTI